MTRDALKSLEWFDQWISYDVKTIGRFIEDLAEPVTNPNFRPQFLREIANKHLSRALRHYSRGDPNSDPASISRTARSW